MGTTACRSKRELPEGIYDNVPRDPRDTARATLLEAQSPAMQAAHPPITTLVHAGPSTYEDSVLVLDNLPVGGRRKAIPLKETDGTA